MRMWALCACLWRKKLAPLSALSHNLKAPNRSALAGQKLLLSIVAACDYFYALLVTSGMMLVAMLRVALIAKSVVTVYGILSRGCHNTFICMIAVSGLMYALATRDIITKGFYSRLMTVSLDGADISTTKSEWVAAAMDRWAQWTDGANS
eukprot:scaffold6408_cov17-Prasinocladus_malaysianus.AAC.3